MNPRLRNIETTVLDVAHYSVSGEVRDITKNQSEPHFGKFGRASDFAPNFRSHVLLRHIFDVHAVRQ